MGTKINKQTTKAKKINTNMSSVHEYYKTGKEKFVTNKSGKIESVVLPVENYNKLIELIEDYGLGIAMKEAENDKFMSKKEALKYLENDKS